MFLILTLWGYGLQSPLNRVDKDLSVSNNWSLPVRVLTVVRPAGVIPSDAIIPCRKVSGSVGIIGESNYNVRESFDIM